MLPNRTMNNELGPTQRLCNVLPEAVLRPGLADIAFAVFVVPDEVDHTLISGSRLHQSNHADARLTQPGVGGNEI